MSCVRNFTDQFTKYSLNITWKLRSLQKLILALVNWSRTAQDKNYDWYFHPDMEHVVKMLKFGDLFFEFWAFFCLLEAERLVANEPRYKLHYRLVRFTPKYHWTHFKMPAAWDQRGKQKSVDETQSRCKSGSNGAGPAPILLYWYPKKENCILARHLLMLHTWWGQEIECFGHRVHWLMVSKSQQPLLSNSTLPNILGLRPKSFFFFKKKKK